MSKITTNVREHGRNKPKGGRIRVGRYIRNLVSRPKGYVSETASQGMSSINDIKKAMLDEALDMEYQTHDEELYALMKNATPEQKKALIDYRDALVKSLVEIKEFGRFRDDNSLEIAKEEASEIYRERIDKLHKKSVEADNYMENTGVKLNRVKVVFPNNKQSNIKNIENALGNIYKIEKEKSKLNKPISD